MKHTYQVVKQKTVNITVRQFVTKYLKQIEVWQDEYDFFVDDSTATYSGYLVRKFSLPINLFSMELKQFNREEGRTKELINHLVKVIEENYKDE